MALSANGTTFKSDTTGSTSTEAACPGSPNDPWGIPSATAQLKPAITAIIATVPDPTREHQTLTFDQTIDGLLQAAADNGYVESFYWLPWKDPAEHASVGTLVSGDENLDDQKRLRQPGLIVLKHFLSKPRWDDSDKALQANYYQTIYLFLVANSPVEGVNGDQLANALKHEGELQQRDGLDFNLSFATPDPRRILAIIGPNTSGAAASLLAQIEYAGATVATCGTSHGSKAQCSFPQISKVELAGGIGGAANALVQLNGISVQVHSVSFSGNGTFEREQLLAHIQAAGYDPTRVANLTEDGTIFGELHAELDTPHDESNPDPKPNPQQKNPATTPVNSGPRTIRFPRGISLLRNAHEEQTGTSAGELNLSVSPYLHMSLADRSFKGTVPHFSLQTPLSQEAALLAITRQLERFRIQFVIINAADILDEIFLTQFLHRAVPDLRIASYGADLLFQKDPEGQPFIGELAISPYNLVAPTPSGLSGPTRPFPSSTMETIYNAASYTFWSGKDDLELANYFDLFSSERKPLPSLAEIISGPDPHISKPTPKSPDMHPSLWAMVVGRDGYYPLGLLNRCASDTHSILPQLQIRNNTPQDCDYKSPDANSPLLSTLVLRAKETGSTLIGHSEHAFPVNPSLQWYAICILVFLASIVHVIGMGTANFWSPLTRDLDIERNDEPSRRAIFIHIGTVMLFCLSVVAASPIFPVLHILSPGSISVLTALATILAGATALVYSFWKTWKIARRRRSDIESRSPFGKWIDTYRLIHLIALGATVFIPILWIASCERDWYKDAHSYVGLFFSFRCLQPFSGVSPLPPVLLLLLAWYVWSLTQTRRIRFSKTSRPMLPPRLDEDRGAGFYVADQILDAHSRFTDSALYDNLTCLFITPTVIERFLHDKHFLHEKNHARGAAPWKIKGVLMTVYLLFFLGVCVIGLHIQTLERLFYVVPGAALWPTPYEFLIDLLFYPLILIALTGWLRMVLSWGALHRGLLRPLERYPIRSAFSRLNSVGWISMMRQNDLHQRHREMARSLESMRQMSHIKELENDFREGEEGHEKKTRRERTIEDSYRVAAVHISRLRHLANPGEPTPNLDPQLKELVEAIDKETLKKFNKQHDLPDPACRHELFHVHSIENDFARFTKRLLEFVLIPHWENHRTEFVEAEAFETVPVHARRHSENEESLHELALHAGPVADANLAIRLAEEFVAIRYLSLIRAVLVNIRHLVTFVSSAFVLSMVAWNSYPFKPREWIDMGFTGLLIILGVTTVWMFAQMYRDTILSRITRTTPNELGGEFYVRVVMFGALPLLTWLAYQFPSVGSLILKYVQPGLEVVK